MLAWGSTFDTTKRDVLIDYLSAYFNPSSPDTIEPLVNQPPHLSAEELSAIKALKGNVKAGEQLYAGQCAICHENPADGVTSGTVLEGNPILYDDQAFWNVVLNGRHDMPSYQMSISNQEVTDILAWLKTLRQERR